MSDLLRHPALAYLSDRSGYRKTIISPSEIFLGPDCETQLLPDSRPATLKTPAGAYPLSEIYRFYPDFDPSLLIIKADASRRNHLSNLRQLSCPKILIAGDTHHLKNPLRTMLAYAASEPFDLVMGEHDRHHLHYFTQAGLKNVIWIPNFNLSPHRQLENIPKQYPLTFIGQMGHYHPYRCHILEALQSRKLPLHIRRASQTEAAHIYAESNINLNISLNGDLNLRVFEVISSGGFLLTDRLAPQSGIDLLFEDGKHFVSFSNIDDLTEKIRYFLQHPEEAFAIARNGCQHYWENYAPEKNIARLMHYLETGEIEDIYRAEYEPRCFA
jgi:hypothetical protein